MNYESPVRYEQARIHAAALYCSDGRMGEHFDDFLHNGLSLPRYHRVSLPGGPACLAGHPQAHLARQAANVALREPGATDECPRGPSGTAPRQVARRRRWSTGQRVDWRAGS